MGKLLIFALLWRLTGNPILAIIVLLIIYYFIDRRYIGLLPSLGKPFRRMRRAANLRRQIAANPHDAPAKYDLARTCIERGQFSQAARILEQLPDYMQETAEVIYDRGLCHLAAGDEIAAEALIREALDLDDTLHYGEPYLKLATIRGRTHPEEALELLRTFRTHNFSSCESYYRMAQIQAQLGMPEEAKESLRQCLETYGMLPRFRKRNERRWAFLAQMRLIF